MTVPSRTRTSRLRRYPALAFLLAAAVLASLLPSSLRVPLSGPSASAELAPVPGKSDASTGDLSALGETSTGGLGAGAGVGGTGSRRRGSAAAPTEDDSDDGSGNGPSGSGRNLRNKRCVGNPPRQTEDPLSPPCVAFFDGDNGGATAKGVTRDEIRLVIAANGCVGGAPRLTEVDPNGTSNWAVLMRHFNERFQTYGRTVRAWQGHGQCSDSAAGYRAATRWVDEATDPFAMLTWGDAKEADEAARLGIWADFEGGSRGAMRLRAPHLRSFAPDLERLTEHVVEFVCEKLAGRVARYSGEPADLSKQRKFAITYRREQDPDLVGRDLVLRGIEERCGDRAGVVETAAVDNFEFADWQRVWTQDLARWRTEGVTTVINMLGGLSVWLLPTVDNTAWRPEWLWASESSGENHYGRMHSPSQMANAFGLQFFPRMPERLEESYRHRAYRDVCQSENCRIPSESDYYRMLLVFRGIQAAGPKLTAANIDRGLRAIAPHPSPDPFTPAAYFAPGNHSFVKDATVVRWDPKGVPPGGAPGCWRYVEHGKRYRVEDWKNHPTDEDFDRPVSDPWPCRGEG